MTANEAYRILQEIVDGLVARGDLARKLPDDLKHEETLEQLGIDLVAFTDIAEEFTRRFEGRNFHFKNFMVPDEFYYLTLGTFLDAVIQPSPSKSKNPIVVYVDDEEENLFIFKRRLAGSLNLKTFTDPLQALDFIRKNSDVALVITDEVMPGMSGNQLCDEVKKTQPNMKFILITGNPNGDEDLMYRSLRQSRFYEFLNKPLDFDRKGAEYLKTIKSLIG